MAECEVMMVNDLRSYGLAPYSIAVIHGGPGAAGEMAPVARVLASNRGVLEPIQTAASLDGQVVELRATLEIHGDIPVTLIGFSWGAWLSFILAARCPGIVKKLILVGSGPFEEKYVPKLQETRLNRLSEEERESYLSLIKELMKPVSVSKDKLLSRLGTLGSKTDRFDPVEEGIAPIIIQGDIFRSVWRDAAALRKSGGLLALGERIHCPVVAIHGSYDPHPAEGVEKPLSAILSDFQFILLEQCGHKPWVERQARDKFFRFLREELA